MRASGMNSDHRVNGNVHSFLIQHDLGTKWSVFTEQLLKQVFRSFLPDKELDFQTTDSTVILNVSLGSDFNEHDFQSLNLLYPLKYLFNLVEECSLIHFKNLKKLRM